ncbi:MAG: SPOR domain-containing protein, partial [Thermoleophilia bacterium]|nr:SPOR domain-containing protein [Thermoleophilia bacterium]
YKQFGALPDVMPAPEPPPPEPVAVAHPSSKTSAAPASAPQAPIPVQTLGTPGAPVDDAALKAALSAIGLQRSQPATRPAPTQARPTETKPDPVAAPAVPTAAPASTAAAPTPAVETVAFADGQDYATGGFIVSDQPSHERRDGGRRTVLAGMVFAEPGQASGYGDPGMTTGGVMVAEAEPETRVSQVAAAAVLPEPVAPVVEAAPAQSFMVQLASFAGWERGRMQGVWRQLSGKATALAGLEPRIVKVGGQKTYTALRVGPLDETSAKDLARSLGDQGIESRMLTSTTPSLVAMALPPRD